MDKKPGLFDVWKLARRFTLHWKWPENKNIIDHALVQSPGFEALYDVQRPLLFAEDELSEAQVEETAVFFEKLEIQKRPKASKPVSNSASSIQSLLDGLDTDNNSGQKQSQRLMKMGESLMISS
jgi:hypothetical protein